jgi:hypothetical protein
MDNSLAQLRSNHRGLLRFEPWQIVVTAFVAGAAVLGVLLAVVGYLHGGAR